MRRGFFHQRKTIHPLRTAYGPDGGNVRGGCARPLILVRIQVGPPMPAVKRKWPQLWTGAVGNHAIEVTDWQAVFS
jgi:hypothetical protein